MSENTHPANLALKAAQVVAICAYAHRMFGVVTPAVLEATARLAVRPCSGGCTCDACLNGGEKLAAIAAMLCAAAEFVAAHEYMEKLCNEG